MFLYVSCKFQLVIFGVSELMFYLVYGIVYEVVFSIRLPFAYIFFYEV